MRPSDWGQPVFLQLSPVTLPVPACQSFPAAIIQEQELDCLAARLSCPTPIPANEHTAIHLRLFSICQTHHWRALATSFLGPIQPLLRPPPACPLIYNVLLLFISQKPFKRQSTPLGSAYRSLSEFRGVAENLSAGNFCAPVRRTVHQPSRHVLTTRQAIRRNETNSHFRDLQWVS
jgi:hypothetical protein